MARDVSARSEGPWGGDGAQGTLEARPRVWPKITVVTPSYNQARYLEATLRSVICQNYPCLEYIVLDGGSDDGSVEIIKRYEEKISYWRSRKDSGQADALASGFSMATGDIFCWLNSDDILLPGALEYVGRFFEKNKEVDFLYGNRKVIDVDGRCSGVHIWPYIITKYHWARGQYLAQECCFWRRGLYQKVGGVDRSKFFIMDYDLFYRMWVGGRFRKTSAFLGCIRLHEKSKNSTCQEVYRKEFAEAIEFYGLRRPGYFMIRFLNRFDAWQIRVDSMMRVFRGGVMKDKNFL